MHNNSMMAQVGEHHDHQNGLPKFENSNYGDNHSWNDINNTYGASHSQSPVYENSSYGMLPYQSHGIPLEPSFPPRMPDPPQNNYPGHHQQLLPLIMPNHAQTTWPSQLTNPASSSSSSAPPIVIPPASAPPPPAKASLPKLSTIQTAPSPRKTLTDSDRRRMCQYHEDNPTVKQTEIGALFGVERSTVSKVLRQSERFLSPEDRSLSPVKRTKGKFPDIEKALSNWAKNHEKKNHGFPLSDSQIKEKARFFANSVGSSESHLKTISSSWLEKFKQKNNINRKVLARRASETNESDASSLNPESTGPSASQTPNGISPISPGGLPSPSPLSGSRSDEDLREGAMGYFNHGGYRHSNSQSTTSLNSAFTDAAASPFSGGPTSPTTPFTFSPDNSGWLPSQHSRLPLPGSGFSRPRSQTFPNLNIDPSYISNQSDNLTPKYIPVAVTAPTSALDSPIHEMSHQNPFQNHMNNTVSISPPPLHHRSSNGSMAPPSASTPISSLSGIQSPQLGNSVPGSPTSDDARRALDTLINFLNHSAPGLADQNEFLTVLNLTKKLQIQSTVGSPLALPGGLHRIAEQEGEMSVKVEGAIGGDC